MNLSDSEVYTSEEAQKILKISDSTFRRLIKRGILRAVKVGGQYRVLGAEILRLFDPRLPRKIKTTVKSVVERL